MSRRCLWWRRCQHNGPAIAVINKTDLVKDPADLEARKAELAALGVFDAVYTVSVREEKGCEEIFDALSCYSVEGPHYFDDDAYTDMPEKELVAELIREKALLYMRDEIPHGIAVVVERFKERPDTDLVDIDVNIYCERESHKGMVIGKGGAMLKKIAQCRSRRLRRFSWMQSQSAVLGQGKAGLAGQRIFAEQLWF